MCHEWGIGCRRVLLYVEETDKACRGEGSLREHSAAALQGREFVSPSAVSHFTMINAYTMNHETTTDHCDNSPCMCS